MARRIRIVIQPLFFCLCVIAGYIVCSFVNPNRVAAAPGYGDSSPLTTMLAAPTAVALDADRAIYVAESSENRLLIFQPDGSYLKTLSGLDKPIAVAVNSYGQIYIGNSGAGSVDIYDADSLQQIGMLGSGDGEFRKPVAIAIDSAGTIYVADEQTRIVKVFNPDGSYRFSFGGHETDGEGFHHPISIAINEATDEILVLDIAAGITAAFIQVFEMDGTFKQRFVASGEGDGTLLFRPLGIAVDDASQIYISDTYTSRVIVYDSAGSYLGRIDDADRPLHAPLGIAYSPKTEQLFITSLLGAWVEAYSIHSITHVAENEGSDGTVDSDSDGLPDSYENQHASLNPMDPSDAGEDPDQDGFTNLQEYQANSDLNSAASNPGKLIFSNNNPSIGEGAGSVALTVERDGGSVGAVSALCFTTELSATAGDDFTPVNTWLEWADGDSAPKTCTVSLIDDTDTEDAETLRLDLNSLSGGVLLGAVDSITVTITDNDGSSVINDFNGDKKSDLLMRNTVNGMWHYYPMDGSEILADAGEVSLMTEREWQVVSTDDFNGDGKADLLLRHTRTYQWYYYPMDGKTVLPGEGTVNLPIDPEWRMSGSGDFNGDGKADLLLRHTQTQQWYYYPMNGKEVLAGEGDVPLMMHPLWRVAGIGDFNADGKADVLLHHTKTQQWYYYPMNGKEILIGEGMAPLMKYPGWRVAGVADFNGDGMADLLIRHALGRVWYYYPMSGRQILEGQGVVALSSDPAWAVAAVGDYNGDGKADVLTRHAQTHQWHYSPMNGREVLADEGTVGLMIDPDWVPAQAAREALQDRLISNRQYRRHRRGFSGSE